MRIRAIFLKLSRQQISLLLTIISLLLWSHSILNTSLEIGSLGLIYGLPVTFFIALSCLTIASTVLWSSKENHSKLLCLQLLVLISALWLIPTVTGGSPPIVNHDYRNFGMIDYIVDHGYFSTNVIAYFSWPGTFITSAVITEVSLVNFKILIDMGLIPFLMQILCLVPLYVFLKNTIGSEKTNYYWLGCWLFYLAQWVPHVHLNPQGYGFFFLLTLLALITNPQIWQKAAGRIPFVIILIAIFTALAVIHLLTALAALCILAVFCLLKRDKQMIFTVIIIVILLTMWNLAESSMFKGKIENSKEFVITQQTNPPSEVVEPKGSSEFVIPEQTNPPSEVVEPAKPSRPMLVLDPEFITEREVTTRMLGSREHNSVVHVRLLFSAIFVLIGMAGAIIVFLFRRNFKTGTTLLIITLIPLILLSLSSQYGELLPRIYLFTLPGMSYFGSMLLCMRSRILLIILLILLISLFPLHVISHYGNQDIDYISHAELSGVNFFHGTTSGGHVLGPWPIGVLENIDKYRQIKLQELNSNNISLLFSRPYIKDLPLYVSVTQQDEKKFELSKNNNTYISELKKTLNKDTNFALIYNNPDSILYAKEIA